MSGETRLDRIAGTRWAYLILAVITMISALPGVFRLPALDRDESRFAQASKQMLETGDYIRIREQEGLRNKKPAGIHWLQAGATAVTSSAEAKQIWSYRLPSMIGAALAAMLTFWAAIPLIGRRAAFLGALLFAPSLLLTSEAHIAKTDGVLVALTVLAMGALARLYVAGEGKISDRRGLALLFWGTNGLSFLIKGPITLLVAGLAALLLVAWERRWKWLKPLAQWQGPALFVLLVLPWFIWVQMATSGAFLEGAVGKDLRDKFVGASEGHGGLPGYHLMFLVTHFFPATLLLIPALVLGGRRVLKAPTRADEATSGLRFLFAWLIPTWLFWELLPTKLSHYILPAYPALALLVGVAAVALIDGVKAPVSRWISVALFALGAIALVFIDSDYGISQLKADSASDFQTMSHEAVLAAWETHSAGPLMTIIALAGIIAVVAFAALKRVQAMIIVAAITAMGIGWHLRTITLPEQTWVQPTVTARAALASVCALPDGNPDTCTGQAPERVRAVYYSEPSLVFTTGTDTTITTSRPSDNTVISLIDPARDEAVISFLINTESAGSDAHDGLSGQEILDQLITQADVLGLCSRASAPYPAFNYSNGDPVVFVALRVEACGS